MSWLKGVTQGKPIHREIWVCLISKTRKEEMVKWESKIKSVKILMFLAKYKLMLGSDCRMIYKAKDYHRKRLKVLEQEKYIRRVNRFYIKWNGKYINK